MSTVVITASYNGAPWIGETLDAVAQQTRPAAAHWVVDDGSQDGTIKIASEFSGVTVRQNPNKGPNAARAFAVAQTTSKYVAILDQDDLWHPEHLALLEDALDANPAAPAAFAGVHRFHTGESIPYRLAGNGSKRVDPWEKFPISTIAAPAQVLIRRDALLEMGGWPVNIVGVADFFTWLRLSATRPLLSISDLTVGYRQHAESYSTALRNDRKKKFLERYLQAASDALKARQSCISVPAGRHEGQLKLFTLMTDWLGLASADSKASRTEIALALDAEVGGIATDFANELWAQAFYFAAPVSKFRRPLWLLGRYTRTPRKADNLRRSLRQVIGHQFRTVCSRFTG